MLYFRTFGRLELTHADGRDARRLLNQPKRLALFAYLALNSAQGPVRRDTLLAVFWPELDAERGRRALRQAIHVLKSAVGDDVVITRGEEEVRVERSGFRCDALEFDELLASGRRDEAVNLYHGDVLHGLFIPDAPAFERWLDEKRTDYRTRAAQAALQIARDEHAAANGARAIEWYRRAAELAPASETPIRALMDLLDQSGNRAAAMQVFDEFCSRLATEYEIEPAPETLALAGRIRTRSHVVGQAATAQGPVSFDDVSTSGFRARRFTGLRVAAMIVGVSMLSGSAVWYRMRPTQVVPRLSVAVLPFVDMSRDEDQAHLVDGMTEDLITALSKVNGLLVPARTSSFVFKGARADIGSIADQLGVAHVLEGSIQRDGDRVRVTAQLIDAHSGFHLWSENYDRRLDDLFNVQEEIAAAIAAALKIRLVEARTTHTPAADAYDLFLKGRYHWHRRNAEGITKAIEYLSAATDRDSTYAAAFAALADAYQLAPTFAAMPPDSAFPAARNAALRAIALDSTLAEPHASLGYVRMHWERDWRGAESSLRRAIELNPGYATAYQWLRLNLLARNRGTEAVAAALRAQQLDPLSSSIQAAVGDTYLYTAQFDLAIPAYERALKIDPEYARARTNLARAYLYAGERKDALRAHRASQRVVRDNGYFTGVMASTGAQLGERADALKTLDLLRRESAARYVPSYAFAMVHAGLGQRDSTLYWLRRSVAMHDNWTTFIPVEPTFADLRDSHEFKQLLVQLGLL